MEDLRLDNVKHLTVSRFPPLGLLPTVVYNPRLLATASGLFKMIQWASNMIHPYINENIVFSSSF